MKSALTDLERVVARDEIRQLAYRYAWAIDSRDIEALVGLFIDDVRVGRDSSGRAALRENFDTQLHEIGVSILFVGNHLIDFDDPDHARGIVYCRGEIQDGDRWIEQAIQYRDKYERREGVWYFARRQHLLWYGLEKPKNPRAQPDADWPANHEGKGTLPDSEETWRRFWGVTD